MEENRSWGMSKCHLAVLPELSAWYTAGRITVYLVPDLSSFISHRACSTALTDSSRQVYWQCYIWDWEWAVWLYSTQKRKFTHRLKNIISTIGEEQQNNLKMHVHSRCDVKWMQWLNKISWWCDKKKRFHHETWPCHVTMLYQVQMISE